MAKARVDTSEIGVSGLRAYSGQVREEFLPDLQGSRARKVYREMSENDPTVGAVLRAVDLLTRKIEWRVDAADDSPEADAEKQFVVDCMGDMSQTWESTISEILTMLVYGWCLPAGAPVMREDGSVTPIEALSAGDTVLTGRGRSRKIVRTYERPFGGDLVCLRVRGYPELLRMTPEHQVPTTMGWRRADQLQAGDVLLRPRPLLKPGGDYDSGWLVGLYLAEGTRDKGRTRVSLHLHAKEVPEVGIRVDRWLALRPAPTHHLATGRASRYVYGKTGGRVTASHPELRALIDDWTDGTGAATKRLRRLPGHEDFARGVWDGWVYGDGGTTISETLARQMQMVGAALGLPSHLRKQRRPTRWQIGDREGQSGSAYVWTVTTSPAVQMGWKRDGRVDVARILWLLGGSLQRIAAAMDVSYLTVRRWLAHPAAKQHGLQCPVMQAAIGHPVQVVTREQYDGPVYDLEVDEDHTFVTGPVAVSNCYEETVYKIRGGDVDDPARNSAYDDGRVGWRKFAIRSQDSLFEWQIDPAGGLQAMKQMVDGRAYTIPIEKSLLFRTSTVKNNPEGRSLLRTAYRPWWFKKLAEETEGIGMVRDIVGLPVGWVPPEYLSDDASPEQKAVVNVMKEILRDVKLDEQGYVLWPLEYNDQGNKVYDFTLVSSPGSKIIDTNAVIMRYRSEIAMAFLADWIVMGHERVGSYALGRGKINMFTASLEATVDEIQAVFNQFGIPRLMRLNGIPRQLWPRLTHESVEEVDLVTIANLIEKLANAGAPMFGGTDELLNSILHMAGLPEISVDTSML